MHSSTVSTRRGSGRAAMPGTGACRRLASPLRRPAEPASRFPSSAALPRPARAWRAAACALLAVLVLPFALVPPAEAQTVTTLTSNTGQTGSGDADLNRHRAQAFTTGSDSAGYALTGVKIMMKSGTGNYLVIILPDVSGSPDGNTTLGTLTNPANLSSTYAEAEHTAPEGGIALAANTTYWVWVNPFVTGTKSIRTTSSNAEDSGGAAGWSIADDSGNQDHHGTFRTSTDSLMISIQGHVAQAPDKPAAPAVGVESAAVSGGSATAGLSVSWAAPSETGGRPITGYDVRWYAGSADPSAEADWIEPGEAGGHDHAGAGTSATVRAGAGGAYRVQVRAVNAVGAGAWSDSGAVTAGPLPVSAAASGQSIVITFDGALTAASVPAARFRYTRGGNGAVEYTAGTATVSGMTVTLGVGHVLTRGEAVTVRYIAPAGDPRLKDSSGPTPDFTIEDVTVNTTDRVPPRVVSAATSSDGARVGITYDINFATPSDTQKVADAFTVKVDGTVRALSGPALVTADLVVLRLSSAVAPGETVTVDYSHQLSSGGRPESPIQTVNTNVHARPFTDFPVENAVLAEASIESVAITSVPSHDANGDGTPDTYRKGESIVVTVTWDREVQWKLHTSANSAIRLRLDVAGGTKTANLVRGTSRTGIARALRFHYVVQTADVDGNGVFPKPNNAGDLVLAVNSATVKTYIDPVTLIEAEVAHAGLSADAGHKVDGGLSDTAAPSFQSVSLLTTERESPELWLNYDERLDEIGPPTAERFTVTVAGSTETHAVESVAVSGPQVVLTLPAPVVAGQTVTLGYAASGNDALRDLAGNNAPDFSGESVSNPDGPPVFLGAELTVDAAANTSTIVATFDEDLDTNAPSRFNFGARDAGFTRFLTPTGLSISGKELTLTWNYAFGHDWGIIDVSHNSARDDPDLQDAAGNTVATVSWPVTDLTPPPAVQSAAVRSDGMGIVLTFDRDMKAPTASEDAGNIQAFRIRGTDVGAYSDLSPSRVTQSGKTVTVWTETVPVRAGQRIRLSYRPGDGGTLRDTANYPVGRFIDLVPDNVLGDGPALVGAKVFARKGAAHASTQSMLRLIYDRALDESSAPAGSAFTVRAAGPDDIAHDLRGTGTASVVGTDVEVALSGRVASDDIAQVSYAKPAANPIRDTDGNEAASFDRENAGEVDEQPPELQSAAVSGRKITLYYDEPLDPWSVPNPAKFKVKVGTASLVNSSLVQIEGSTAVVWAATAAGATDTVIVTYTTDSVGPIRDLAGNRAGGFSITPTNVGTTNPGTPTLSSAVADGAAITLTYDQPLDPASVPTPDRFSFDTPRVQGASESDADYATYLATYNADPDPFSLEILRIAVEGKKVVLTLQNPLSPCAYFRMNYVRLGANTLQNLFGEFVNSIGGQVVTNAGWSRCRYDWISSLASGSVIITAKRPFAQDVTPKPEWFTVNASGGPVTVTEAAYSPDDARVLKLELSREFAPGETATASYRRPRGERGLWDVDGNQLGDVTDWPVAMSETGPPSVTGVALVSDAGEDATYALGERIRVRLTFSAPVDVDTSGGAPQLSIDMDPAHWGTKQAVYEGGSGTAELTFAHRVVEPNESVQGIAVLADTLALGGGTIRSAATETDAELGHEGLGHDPAHKVDWRLAPPPAPAPAATGVAVVSDAGGDATYALGETIRVRVTFDEAVAVTGAPQLAIDMDPADWGTKQAGYEGGSGTAELTFAHTVVEPNESTQGIAVLADTLALNGGTIRSAATDADAALDHAGLGHDPAHKVDWRLAPDTTAPAVESAVVDRNRATVTFDEELAPNRIPDLWMYWQVESPAVTQHPGRMSVSGKTVTMHLTTEITAGQSVSVIHEPSGISDAAGNRVPYFKVAAENLTLPTLSVADARTTEGPDAEMAFAVRLDAAMPDAVTVDYATADGTAKAGEDYTAASGTLTFAAGEREKTVSVPVLDDALDEGSETFKLKLSNAQGARIADGEATGTIVNADPLQKMWLSRFGRTVADHVTAAVSDRLSGPLAGAQVTVGGQTVDLAETQDDAFLGRTLTSIAQIMGAPTGPAPANDPGSGLSASEPGHAGAEAWPGTGLGTAEPPASTSASGRLMTGRDLLLGSAFHLAREGDGATPGLAAWGRVTVGGFDGEAPADAGNVRIDGNVTTGIIGTDAEWHRLLAGVAISVSEGEGTFDLPGVDSGTIESTMTTVSPYARVTLNERVSVWGLAGYGTGDMTIVQAANEATGQPERTARTDLSMRLVALGGRGALLTADANGGFDLALKADGFFVETTSEAISNEGDTTGVASRVRLALEGSRAFELGGGTFTPGLELGLRHDGGDAETGTGVELGGRLSYADPDTGLSVEAKVRALVAHEDSNYREWGASGAVSLAPGERGRGLSFSLAPTWGAPGSGVDRLWSARDARGLAPTGGDFEPESRLEGELGYGIGLFGDRFTGTPNLGFGLSGAGTRDWRIGWRLTSAVRGDPGFEVTLDATRKEPANDNGSGTPAEHGVMLRAAVRW